MKNILIILCLITAVACKKQEPPKKKVVQEKYIKFRFLNSITNEPIKGLGWSVPQGSGYFWETPDYYSYIIYSDSDGYLSVPEKYASSFTYSLPEDYGREHHYDSLNLTYYLEPVATLKLRLIHKSNIKCWIYLNSPDHHSYYRGSFDTIVTCKTPGGWIDLNWDVYRAYTDRFYGQVNIAPGATGSYTIEYNQ